jgi:hypothetical protein
MNNYIGEVVEIIPPTEITIESIADYISQCSSVVRDKEPANAMKLLNRLMTESYGDTASRVLEYIPCKIGTTLETLGIAYDQLFGFDTNTYNTNARELLNWGWTFDEVLAVVDFTNYKTFHCVAPYFIYGQLSTHTQITSVSHSQRYGTCDRGYWMPPEIREAIKIKPLIPTKTLEDEWTFTVENSSPLQLKTLMKDAGIVRKEVWDRGADSLQNRVFTLGGYTSNPNAFTHFRAQRLDSHTQLETRDFVQLIKDQL